MGVSSGTKKDAFHAYLMFKNIEMSVMIKVENLHTAVAIFQNSPCLFYRALVH